MKVEDFFLEIKRFIRQKKAKNMQKKCLLRNFGSIMFPEEEIDAAGR